MMPPITLIGGSLFDEKRPRGQCRGGTQCQPESEETMAFSTASVLRFAADRNVPPDEVEKIKLRAAEATRDFGGADGEFSGSRINFVLGRELAEAFQAAREGNLTRYSGHPMVSE